MGSLEVLIRLHIEQNWIFSELWPRVPSSLWQGFALLVFVLDALNQHQPSCLIAGSVCTLLCTMCCLRIPAALGNVPWCLLSKGSKPF